VCQAKVDWCVRPFILLHITTSGDNSNSNDKHPGTRHHLLLAVEIKMAVGVKKELSFVLGGISVTEQPTHTRECMR